MDEPRKLKESLLSPQERNIDQLRNDEYYPSRYKTNNLPLNNQPQQTSMNTLYESIWSSLERDLSRIVLKMRVVILPYVNEEKLKELQQWDLWGPFVMCLILGIILSATSKKANGLVFSTVFIIIWIGSMVITINSSLLGGKLSLLQCICLLGYCIFPIDVAALLVRVFLSFLPGFVKLAIVGVSLVWSSKASVPFIAQNIGPNKKILAVYPVVLFFVYLNYFILV